MPELPEVEGVVRQLKPIIEGKAIIDVAFSQTVRSSIASGKQCILKNAEPEQFIHLLKGTTIERVVRRSKYIFLTLQQSGEPLLLVNHLGMTGAWFIVQTFEEILEEKFRKHIHATFTLHTGELLVYSDIRRFGEFRLLQELKDYPPLLKLAPEPFDEDACTFFLEQCEKSKYVNKAIKAVIMDGQVISGCGNIYATEALFKEGINPSRQVNQISKQRKSQLFYTIQAILQESIDVGGSTISDYRNVNGEAGGMQHRLKMYGKKTCPTCGTATASKSIGGRTSVYCPVCQG